ncbi:MAG: MBOAT family protein, partial [Deltaproteobacteria bacterium]|nr:MBOAT family protein [Deltaproteobacteria bacterium]
HLTAKTGGEGMFLIAAGLFKKVVIGDYIALNLVDRVFAEPSSYSSIEVMTAMYGYAVQVYCDFAGYSDIAIGSALLLGYGFKINFDAPFKSLNIVEFWRRWHVSLSTWLRDYVYIPLGGGRKGRARKYLNMFLTMVICGVWHGAAWTYFIFGCIQGLALVITHWFQEVRGVKPGQSEKEASLPVKVLCIAANFTFVGLTFTMFRAASLDGAWAMYERLLTFTTYTPNLHPNVALVILGALLLQWSPRRFYDRAREWFIAAPAPAQAAVLFCVALALRESASADAVPFVYFQF